MASFYVTPDVICRTLANLYYGHKPVPREKLMIALRQNGFSDDYMGSLETHVDAYLNQLIKDGRVSSARLDSFVPMAPLQHQHPRTTGPIAFSPWTPPVPSGFHRTYFGSPMMQPFSPGPPGPEFFYRPLPPVDNPQPSFPPWDTRMGMETEEEGPPVGINMTPIPTEAPPSRTTFEPSRQTDYEPSGQQNFESSHPTKLESPSETSSYASTMLTTTAPSSAVDLPTKFYPMVVTSDEFHQFIAEANADAIHETKKKLKENGP